MTNAQVPEETTPTTAQPLDSTPPEATEQPAPDRRPGWNVQNRPFVVAAATAGVLAVALVGTVLATSDVFAGGQDISVSFALTDSDLGESCQGDGGYSDIGSGTPVRLTNEAGDLLAATSLGDGSYFGGGCLWSVTLPDVATGAGFYSVEIADRGQITKSASELEADDWSIDVSLG